MNKIPGVMRTAALAATLSLGTLGLGACTILPETEALKVYQFPPPSTQPADNIQELDLSLRINTPQAGFALSGPRMLVNPEGHQLSTYKGARWSDPSPALMREHISRAFSLHGGVRTISTDEHTLHADVHLSNDMRRFQVNYYEGGPRAVIEMESRLIEASSRRVIANRTFLVEEPLADEQVPGVVKAFGVAADRLTEAMIPWALSALQQREPATQQR